MQASKLAVKSSSKDGITAKDGHLLESGPSAFLNQWITRVNPKNYAPAGVVMIKNQAPKPVVKNKTEADTTSSLVQLTRESNFNFTSFKFLENDASTGADPALPVNRFKTILLTEGMGNLKDCYYYSKQALETAVPLFEGKKIYADHPSKLDEQVRPERSVRDILGHFENVHLEVNKDGQSILVGDVVIPMDEPFLWARSLMGHAVTYAKKYPDKDLVGLSINAGGDAEDVGIDQLIEMGVPDGSLPKLLKAKEEGNENVKIVTVIAEATSCDLVTEAGAGGKILALLEADMKKENKEGGPGSGPHKGGGLSAKGKAAAERRHARKMDQLNKDAAFNRHSRKVKAGQQRVADNRKASAWAADTRAAKKAAGLTGRNKYRQSSAPTDEQGSFSKYIEGLNYKGVNVAKKIMESDKEEEVKEAGADSVAGDEHADAGQDMELIKQMIAKYMGAEDLVSDEECDMVKQAYEACMEMGMDESESGETAVKQMKLAKHMASKMPAVEADPVVEADPIEEAEEAEENNMEAIKESNIKLTAKVAKLEQELKITGVKTHLDKIMESSKLPTQATKKFRDLVKDAKSTEEIDRMFKVYESAYKDQPAAGKVDFTGAFIQPEKSNQSAGGGKADLFAGVFKK